MKSKSILVFIMSAALTACTDMTSVSSGGLQMLFTEEHGLFSVCSYEDSSMYRATLTCKDAEVYDKVLESLLNFDEELIIYGYDSDGLKHIYRSVLADHPEIFYLKRGRVATYHLTTGVDMLKVLWDYHMTDEYAVNVNGKIHDCLNEYIKRVKDTDSDYDKLRIACEYVAELSEYDKGSFNSQNIDSVFMWGKSVCGGYARAYKFLLNNIGIDCKYVVGRADGELHAWNVVYFDGKEYGVDVTWCDSLGNLDYFLVPIEEFNKTHIEDDTYIIIEEVYENEDEE